MATKLVLNRTSKAPAEETVAFGAVAERFRRAGALEKAVNLCREGLKRFPDHISARVTLGWSLLDLGQYEDARQELEQVLRQAPDNLAAIRGLAELHDRFEHTMNLPMDGPGQWPPSADELEHIGEVVIDATPSAVEFAGEPIVVLAEPEVEMSTPVIVPAEMGLPLWSPGAAEVAPVSAAPASGMSSIREIDPHAAVVDLSSATTTPTAAPSDAEIQALIAEAESLEVAAEMAAVETMPAAMSSDPAPALDLVADVDLSSDTDLVAQLDLASVLEVSALDVADPEAGSRVLQFTPVVQEPELVVAPVSQEPVAAEPMVAEAAADEVGEVVAQALPVTFNDVVADEVAAVVDITSISRGTTAARRSPVPALERMLAKVQARRAQLMTESVA